MVECEYGTGTTWVGDSMIASVRRSMPPGTEAKDYVVHEKGTAQGWVNWKLLSKEIQTTEEAVKRALEAQKR